MEILNVSSYVLSTLFLFLLVHTYIIKPMMVRNANKKHVEKKVIDPESRTKYWKFNYSGPIYFEAPEQSNAYRLFKKFKANQTKFGKLYDLAHKKKAKNREKNSNQNN